MCHIIRDRDGIGDAAAGEGEALLILQVWMVFDLAEPQGMHAAIEEAGRGERRDVGRRHRTIGDAARFSFDLDQRLQPEQAA